MTPLKFRRSYTDTSERGEYTIGPLGDNWQAWHCPTAKLLYSGPDHDAAIRACNEHYRRSNGTLPGSLPAMDLDSPAGVQREP